VSTAVFYAVSAAAALLAIAIEVLYSLRKKKNWHAALDTIGNLNLAAGNIVLGAMTAGIALAGYGWLYSLRVCNVSQALPAFATIPLAIVFADFLQYWNHRLSHDWNFLWWGHLTHHSSSHFNLSTGIRINWLYRSYAWLLYAPMPLLGFRMEEFILGLTVISTYNLFMHTRANLPFGPLAWLLVTPLSHRLHHSADPKHFGNYGAALIVWDRLFGTYRELSAGEDADALTFGVDRNVDTTDTVRLNFDYLIVLWAQARAARKSFLVALFSQPGGDERAAVSQAAEASARVSRKTWWGLSLVAVVAMAVNQAQAKLPLAPRVAVIASGVLLVVAFGAYLERLARREMAT
jgi:sterol desaturase/sphingolipid hydroxylase (fatty acid hydroxylase superfamily)